MDVNARELLLQPKRNQHKKAKIINLFVFLVTFLLGSGLIVIGIIDYRNQREGDNRNEPPAQAISDQDPNQIQGATTCDKFNSERDTLFKQSTGSRKWVLLGHEFPDASKSLQYKVEFNKDPLEVGGFSIDLRYRIVGIGVEGDLIPSSSPLIYETTVDLKSLDPGAYKIEAYLDTPCGTVTSNSYSFNLSYPIYVVWSMDWEGYEVSDAKMDSMDRVSQRHHNIPMTHFFNPRYLIPGVISNEQKQKYLDYILKNRDYEGHSIGIHLHAFPEIMSAAGVTPHSTPRWGWSSNDGYDVLVSGYSYSDMNKVLDWADQVFRQNGLGSPNMFRAGGWWIEEDGLKALEDNNYLLDSSGRESYTLGTNGYYGPWDLSSTTMPYRPNYNNQNSSYGDSSELMKLWEFPNNGADSTAFTAEQLYQNFRDNYSGTPLNQHKVVTYLSHPDYFHIDQPRMDELLSYIDRDLYSLDDGPVIYGTLEDVFNIYIEL